MALQQLVNRAGGSGRREQEALTEVAPLSLELVASCGACLYALTQGFEPERLAELDEGVDQRPATRAIGRCRTTNERSIFSPSTGNWRR